MRCASCCLLLVTTDVVACLRVVCSRMYVDSRFVCTVHRSRPWREEVDAFHGKYSELIHVN